uniref:Carbohydrate kinase FGGY N-terminal domain-containing protein n=1 Tax=Peronospora matthiolae TaxID=2874970 RepID=A0AAV1TQH1_9STRA
MDTAPASAPTAGASSPLTSSPRAQASTHALVSAAAASSDAAAGSVLPRRIHSERDDVETATNRRRRLQQQRCNYSVKKKRELIALAQVAGVREVCRMEGIPRRTLRHWLDDAEKINSFEGPESRKSIGRSGRRELLPFGRELTTFLLDGRLDGREVTSSHMIGYIREHHQPWLDKYLADKKSAESGQAALTRLCQRFVERHGFTQTGSAMRGRDAGTGTDTENSNVTFQVKTETESEKDCGIADSATPKVMCTNISDDHGEDDSPLLCGLDIGTTAVKCVLVKIDDGGKAVGTVAVASVPLSDVLSKPTGLDGEARVQELGVQNVDQVLLAVQRAVMLLPAMERRRVTSVGICGQMHGIVWWRSCSVHEAAERVLAADDSKLQQQDDASDECAWSELITWQDQRCTPSFLDSCREKIAHTNAPGGSSAFSPIAAGYGLATFAHTLEHSPRTLVGMDACGTIHDFVAFVLCGHTLPSEVCMDTTDAYSWGGFGLQTQTWDSSVLHALQVPSSMLPAVKKPGTCVGHTSPGLSGFGLPDNKPVFVPMGDHPCSVLAALAHRQAASGSDGNLTLVNVGTSAQVALVLASADVAKFSSCFNHESSVSDVCDNSTFEVRPFLFEDRYVGVAASLSGGNAFAWLVQQWQLWAKDMGLAPECNDYTVAQAAQREAEVYARLIELGLQRKNTELTFVPTINGERANPGATGSILNLRMNNWSMGDISAALARGLVDNLFAMIPTELRQLVALQPMIGTGNALVRNGLLQHFLLRHLDEPSYLQLQTATDAAVGAALAPLLVSGTPVMLDSLRGLEKSRTEEGSVVNNAPH